MEGRGRKSTASLSVVATLPVAGRVDPPDGLTDAQRALWHEIAAPLPIDWWNASNAPLLAEYVRAVDMCNRLGGEIERALSEGDAKVIGDMLRLRDMESRRAVSLATKMRISQQATYNAKSGHTAKAHGAAKPWNFGSAK